MATRFSRARTRRSARTRRVAPEVAALHSLLATHGPQALLNASLAKREAVFDATRPAPSAKAARARAAWTREGRSVAREFAVAVKAWDRGWTTLPDFTYPARELLHVYGADVTGHGGDDFYAFEWGQIDPFAGTGSNANADRKKGLFGAGHYTTSGWLHAHAGVGIRIVPKTGVGLLSVRPYVNWSGNDLLQHRVFDPQLGEQRWGVAIGSVGIIVQSRLVSGGDFRTDAIFWQEVWHRAQLNPQSAADYDGTASAATGLTLDVPVSSTRSYSVWVVCRAAVFADPGFAVATRTGAAINCAMPFLVVQEVPA